MKHNHILDVLRSPNATLGVLALALIAQMPHAADVFRLIVHGQGWSASAHSYTFAIALELAVLLFVVQNRHAESYGFAAVSIAMNLSYYYLHNVQLLNAAALPALLVSVALPVAIARYSHAVADVAVQPEHKPAQSKPDTMHSERAEDAQSEPDSATAKRQRAAQLHSEGLSYAQIASELNVHRNTISAWLKSTNGHTAEVAQ